MENKRYYLIQTGLFRNDLDIDLITGFDSLVSIHYMGAAEFEFGSLPKSLKNIAKNSNDYEFYKIKGTVLKNVNNESMYLYCNKSLNKEDYIKFIKKDAKGKCQTKRYDKLNSYLKNNFNELDIKNYDNMSFCNFWWDIENHVFFFYGESKIPKIIKAIDCLKEKWKDELFPPTSNIKLGFFDKIKKLLKKG